MAPVHSLNIAVSNGPVKEPRAALEWTVGVCFYGNVSLASAPSNLKTPLDVALLSELVLVIRNTLPL